MNAPDMEGKAVSQMNEIALYKERALPMSAAEIREHVNLIQRVMKAVMKEGTHYGKIPGTDKPTLYKAGAEVLCTTFHIRPRFELEDLSGEGFVRYRIRSIGSHQATGIELGEGLGECSSMEEKYKWRKAYKREWDETPETHRRKKYGWNSAQRSEFEVLQVRTEAADLANTILKMACKRALVAMTLNVTAASDIFTQDIEDLSPELRDSLNDDPAQDGPKVEQPRAKSEKPNGQKPPADDKPITEQQQKLVAVQMDNATLTLADLKAKFGYEAITQIPFSRLNEVLEWIRSPGA